MHVFDISQQNNVTENFLLLTAERTKVTACWVNRKRQDHLKKKNASTINTCHFKIHIENKLNTK